MAVVALAGFLLIPSCSANQGGASQESSLSCAELARELEDEVAVLRRSFGEGEEARDAMQAVSEVVEQRPECVSTVGVEDLVTPEPTLTVR